MHLKFVFGIVGLIFIFPLKGLGQSDSIGPKAWINLGLGYQFTLFDLSARYGSHGVLQGAIHLKKKAWELGPTINYIYGSVVKEDVLKSLRSVEGDLIGEDHQIAIVDLRQRGLSLGLNIAYALRLRDGHTVVAAVQPLWMAHWIRFQNSGNTFRPIQGIYRYGYDRLSSGLGLLQSLGYRYQSKSKLINFEVAIQLTEANTRLKRNIQLDAGYQDPGKRLDGYLGIVAKWIIPIYRSQNPDQIYY